MTSTIDLPKTTDTGSFARYVPFDDRREVIVRRGGELGFHYGLEQGRRRVALDGGEFALVTFRDRLSPPPLPPGGAPLPPEALDAYDPVSDVVYLPDAEVLIPRGTRGFSDPEVETILAAISVR